MIDWGALKNNHPDLQLPAAFIDAEAFEANTRKFIEITGDKIMRIATKSLRVPELISRVVKESATFQGVLCYSCQEITPLRALGVDDFLVAYPTMQKSDLDAAWGEQTRGTKLALMVDCVDHLEAISHSAPQAGGPMRVCIDVDMSLRIGGAHLGVRRSPVRTTLDLKRLLEEARRFPRVRVIGLMGYEAQIAGLGDRSRQRRILNPIKRLIRIISRGRVARLREELRREFLSSGLQMEIFNGGGTGSLNWATAESALTELTAGSGLFSTHLFDGYSNIHFEPAGFFALSVCRSSDSRIVTCQGGGYIGSGEPGWDRLPMPVWPWGLSLVGTEGAGEVQTPLHARGEIPSIGSWVVFRSAKAGEALERFAQVHYVSRNRIEASFKNYRGAGIETL